jgi:DNA-binding Xre family transcriptional regulator
MAELGITNYALRNKFHISPATFEAWDRNGGRHVRPDTLRRLADALRVTYLDLIRRLRVGPGDFSEVGRKLTEARLRAAKTRKKREA